MIEQATGCRNENVRACAKGVFLRSHANATEDSRRRDRRVHGELLQFLENLSRQLACWRENECARGAARPTHEPLQDRQQKGGGLAASGHGAREHVASRDSGRNSIDLDRRRPSEAQLLDAA